MIVTEVCKLWCVGNKQTWGTKCAWSERCGGCSECFSESILCKVNIDKESTTSDLVHARLVGCSNCIHGDTSATDLVWRLYSCIADEVLTKKNITTLAPKTNPNAQGQSRMPNWCFLQCRSRRWISSVIVTALCKSWCAGNKQTWGTKCIWSERCDGCSECLGG